MEFQLLMPEILEEARELSVAVLVIGLLAGVLLWLTGWWAHRFWIVLAATALAGVFGLYEAPVLRMQPLLAALLMAMAAGMLGLSLMRLLAFSAGGFACLGIVHALVPSANAPIVCFLAGGLIATILFRLWLIFLTSAAGTVLAAYCGLCLADHFIKIDLIQWVNEHAILINWSCVGLTVAGCVLQVVISRLRKLFPLKKKKDSKSDSPAKSSKVEKILDMVPPFRDAA